MTLSQVECFMVLSQRLNFTQAADALFMAQPALSRTISALEKELEVQLFTRSSHAVSLTPAGNAFLKECPTILDSYHRSVTSARLARDGYRGSLKFGVLRDSFQPSVVDICRAMRETCPDIHIFLEPRSHSELHRHFWAGDLDVIVNFGSDAPMKETESIVLRRDRQCVVVPIDSPLAAERSLRMEDLRKEKFVAMSRTSSQSGHDFLWRIAGDAGFVPNVVAETDHVPSLLMMVACGVGVTTITEDLQYLTQGRVAFVPLVGVPLSSHALIWMRGNENPSLPYFLDVVQKITSP